MTAEDARELKVLLDRVAALAGGHDKGNRAGQARDAAAAAYELGIRHGRQLARYELAVMRNDERADVLSRVRHPSAPAPGPEDPRGTGPGADPGFSPRGAVLRIALGAADRLEGKRRCPDDGACHHGCTTGCFRVLYASPLSAAGWGDRWPDEIRAANTETDGLL